MGSPSPTDPAEGAATAAPLPPGGQRAQPLYGPALLCLLLLPFAMLLSLGMAYPLANALGSSLSAGDEFGLQYKLVADDRIFWLILNRTLYTAATVSVLCVLIAYPIAECINRATRRFQPVLLALVVIPLWSSAVARTYSWVGIFRRDGVLDNVVGWFGLGPQYVLFTWPAVIVGMVHVMLPFLILPLYAALRRYDHRLSQASLSLGASRLRTFLQVKLPVLAPQLAAGATAIFILSLGFYITPAVLGGPRTQMISNLIAQQVFQRYDVPRGYAIAAILIFTTLVTLLVLGGGVQLVRRRLR